MHIELGICTGFLWEGRWWYSEHSGLRGHRRRGEWETVGCASARNGDDTIAAFTLAFDFPIDIVALEQNTVRIGTMLLVWLIW